MLRRRVERAIATEGCLKYLSYRYKELDLAIRARREGMAMPMMKLLGYLLLQGTVIISPSEL